MISRRGFLAGLLAIPSAVKAPLHRQTSESSGCQAAEDAKTAMILNKPVVTSEWVNLPGVELALDSARNAVAMGSLTLGQLEERIAEAERIFREPRTQSCFPDYARNIQGGYLAKVLRGEILIGS